MCGWTSCQRVQLSRGGLVVKVAAVVPPRTRAFVFLFPSAYEGACGFLGSGQGWQTFRCLALSSCDLLTPNHLHQASLNCPLCSQPLDLCNPARTLLLSEELLLYEGRNKAAEVRLTHAVPRWGALGWGGASWAILQAPNFSVLLRIVQSQGRKYLKSLPPPPPRPPSQTVTQLFLVHFQR